MEDVHHESQLATYERVLAGLQFALAPTQGLDVGQPRYTILSMHRSPELADSGFVQVLRQRGHTIWSRLLREPISDDLAGIDLVILDLDDLPTAELASYAAQCQSTGAPLLLLVSPTSLARALEGLALGADSFVLQPCDAGEFIARVEGLIRRFRRTGAGLEAVKGEIG